MGEWPLRRPVLLSISGGRDSVALLHAMLEVGIRPVLFHSNYLLRGEDSNMDAQLVAELASQHDLVLESIMVPKDWKEELHRQGLNLQDAARRFRYDALHELSAPGGRYAWAIVATAHHAMDQAETVLLALLKGRNIKRLSGLQSNLELWRPWLEVMPSELEAYAQAKAMRYRHDASNDSPAYDRNYLRIHLAPLFQARFPGWIQSCLRASRHIQESQNLVAEFSKTMLEPYVDRIQDPCWGKVVRLRQGSSELEHGSAYAGNLWRSMGANYSQENSLEHAWELPVGKMLYCGKGQVFRQRNALCYFENVPSEVQWLQKSKGSELQGKATDDSSENRVAWKAAQRTVWQAYVKIGHQFTLQNESEPASDWGFWVEQGWHLRPWEAGDRFTLSQGHRKLVSDLLQENRVERPFKDTWPVICHHGRVVGCPLPSRPNGWEMSEDGALRWEWKAYVNYVMNE